MGSELEDERRMTRVETILEAHETILLRIEAKMDEKFATREDRDALQRQIDELRNDRRYGTQTWAFWISAIAAIVAVVFSFIK